MAAMASPPEKTPAELFATPVQFLKGVGPQRAEQVRKLGLETARDVIFFFPRDYQDLTELTNIADLTEDSLVRLHGEVVEVDQRNTSSGGTMLGALVRCGSGAVRALWFNHAVHAETSAAWAATAARGQGAVAGWHLGDGPSRCAMGR